ncbi:FecR family protein [Chitinophaga sp. CF118]|uniref:FecR family protein n=1 Tax=Chitinophaga sp. CF118 TaxID=1884367 RepID=UPI0008E833B2|nr:FecR family protein [Chitinophaga sp. CF118]SFD46752.1 FecR family protein [Chitinophaga sp. CF118]
MERIKQLFNQYYTQTASDDEIQELMNMLEDPVQDQVMASLLEQQWENLSVADPRFSLTTGQPILETILGKKEKVRFISRFRWAAAAAVLLLAGITTFFWQQPGVKPQLAQVVMPGTNKAVLTLADGSSVTLNSTGNQVIKQGNTTIRQSGGLLQYAGSNNDNRISYNTLTTPRGGQFHLTLPDGTDVWLNAGSSITFPTAFTSADRTVNVTGEAYFDVTKMAGKPFFVRINKEVVVQVLGTSFNINAYTDEPFINTTLVEGRVGLLTGNNPQIILLPGQQGRITGANIAVKVLDNINVDQVVSWKNGAFDFDGTDLSSVLRQLSRWYDVEVVFSGKVPERHFGGAIQRNLQLLQVLHILEKMDVKFRMDGRKLIVGE